MARKPRIHFPGAFYHVMLRDNGGQHIFFESGKKQPGAETRAIAAYLVQEKEPLSLTDLGNMSRRDL